MDDIEEHMTQTHLWGDCKKHFQVAGYLNWRSLPSHREESSETSFLLLHGLENVIFAVNLVKSCLFQNIDLQTDYFAETHWVQAYV